MYFLDATPLTPGGTFRGEQREPEIILRHSEQAIALSEENGFSEWLHWGRFTHGWALAELGQLEQGTTEMEAAIAGFEHMGGVPFQPYGIALLARSYARKGRTSQAFTMVGEALARINRTGEKVDQAEILRLKGEVLLSNDQGAIDQPEACFREALQVARAQEAKWWELRSSVSLARLLRDTNRCDEARTMLSEIYNWFTEGFDLPDLNEAKTLIEELGGQRL